MDAYEATRVVLMRIQRIDPENAAKIMGLLLLQDHGEKEMIRLALGPETLLYSVVLHARKELGLLPPSFALDSQNSSSFSPRVATPVFSPRPSMAADGTPVVEDDEELVSPNNRATASPFYRVGSGNIPVGPRSNLFDLKRAGQCRSPRGEGETFPYSLGSGAGSGHRRSYSAASSELFLDSDTAGLGWKPCTYFARGFCKDGSSCRYLHGLPDEMEAAAMAAGGKSGEVSEQACHDVLLSSRSPGPLISSAFPFSPTGSLPVSPSGTRSCMNFLLQQQNESQRAAMAAAKAAMLLGCDEAHKFIWGSRMMERHDFGCSFANPEARQIYLTFPADSAFTEEDVSSYFSIYGPVHDVRIPYQQKRMFGFVSFVYPETVKLILAKGNPHFVCDARVLVKPYKEKGKVPEKYRKQQQQQTETGDFSTPTDLEDTRDAFELQQLGSRMLYSNRISQEMLLKRKLEEQQQAAELQHAIELQRRRIMGLQLLDLKNRSQFSSFTGPAISSPTIAVASESVNGSDEDKSLDCAAASTIASSGAPAAVTELHLRFSQQCAVDAIDGDHKQESCNSELTSKEETGFQECTAEHNLPESPFASPTKASSLLGGNRSLSILLPTDESLVAPAASPCTNNASCYNKNSSPFAETCVADMPSFNSCFFQMPRLHSDHGDAGNVNDGVNSKQLLSPVQGAVSMQ